MPIFEYVCNACDNEYEELVLGGQHPPCPQCGSADTTKLISKSRFRTGGPIVSGSPSSNAITTRGKSGCGGCSGGNCASCG